MRNARRLCLLGAVLVVTLWMPGIVSAQDSAVQIGDKSYSVVDRIDYSAHRLYIPNGVQYPVPHKPLAPVCRSAGLAGHAAADDLFRIPNDSSGFLAAVSKVSVSGLIDSQPPSRRGKLEIALFNPCPEPIAVPVVDVLRFQADLPKDGARFDANQLWISVFTRDRKIKGLGRMAFVAAADRKDSYRVLRQNEAVVLVVQYEVVDSFMDESFLKEFLPTLSILARYGRAEWTAEGQLGTRGEGWEAPGVTDPVPVEFGN